MLEQIRAQIRAALDERAKREAEMKSILDAVEAEGRSDLSSDEAEKIAEARAAIVTCDEKRKSLEARVAEIEADVAAKAEADEAAKRYAPAPKAEKATAEIRVGSEPLTYRQGGQHSYFRDLVQSRPESGRFTPDAAERLARHGVEMRANMNRTDGTGGEFVPPLWLMDQYVALARAGRVAAELCNKMPLPGGTDSINLPKVSTGTATAEQSDGASVTKTDMTTTSTSAAVTTIAGQQVFAIQLLDQSPINFDQVVFQDLLADLAVRVDSYVLNKASIGILNISGINSVTYTDASPTVPEAYPKLADAINQIHTGRFVPPQAILMHPRRWAWILAALDSSSRPLVVPSGQGPQNAFAGFADVRSEGSVGSILGLPVYVDANVPTNLGAGTNEDRIIAARFDDLHLYEGDIRTRVLFETDADTLSVRLQVWEYLAFLGGRYPKAVSVVSGTGLVTPTF